MCEMFNDEDIQQQLNIKQAFDEKSLLNPAGHSMRAHRPDVPARDPAGCADGNRR